MMNIQKLITIHLLITTMVFVTSCGGGGSDNSNSVSGDNSSPDNTSPEPPNSETPQAKPGKLVRSDETKLSTYFQNAIKQNNTVKTGDGSFQETVGTPVLASADASFSTGAAASTTSNASGATGAGGILSSTNIQERGVDEADLLKTDASGRYIYSIKKAFNEGPISFVLEVDTPIVSTDGSAISVLPPQRSFSDIIRIMDTQGSQGITEIKSLSSDKDESWNISGLYLHDTENRLIALSSSNQNFYTNWFNSFYFAAQETEVLLIDVKDPANAAIENRLHFDGQLIDSRRNGDTLYLVLRHFPDYQYVDDLKLAATTTESFLPDYRLNDEKEQPISRPENCYIEDGTFSAEGANGENESSRSVRATSDIITLVAVDLASATPKINSQCYVGSAEAIYASQNALYLATTRWDYGVANGIARYNSKVTTDIHKFAYDGLDFDYRGSGEVNGHLGFKQDSKSFRFSEHEGALRVITFDEDQWVGIFPLELPVDVEVDPLPVEPNQPIGTPIPVEPDGGIGDGAVPLPVLLGQSGTSSTTAVAPTQISVPSPVAPKNILNLSNEQREAIQDYFRIFGEQGFAVVDTDNSNTISVGDIVSVTGGFTGGSIRDITLVANDVRIISETTRQARSPVSLTILKEDANGTALEVISKLPNENRPEPIGLPREQLYATRFIGNRGYVVTFRVTDPLYVLDLSDPTDPFIAGELKIDGYSDYIHPISDNLLLGVGKDAIPATSNGFGDGRGAWYQGVKLTLVDITDPSNPREADKVVIGKRGTESTVLQDHHGFTGVRVNNTYRFALPIDLHNETKALPNGKMLPPNFYYGYTETGLYRYEIDIDRQKIAKVPAMIVENSETRRSFQSRYDRSVFINDNVFYMHDGKFWSQDWHGDNPLTGPK